MLKEGVGGIFQIKVRYIMRLKNQEEIPGVGAQVDQAAL
jgi:hypothetical protein